MQMDKVKLRWSGWEANRLDLKPQQEMGASSGESRTAWGGYIRGRGPLYAHTAGAGIKVGCPAVRSALMDHHGWWNTKAALCLAPMCSRPSEGSSRGAGVWRRRTQELGMAHRLVRELGV